MDDFLAKPFQEKELLHLISRLLLGKPLEEESAPEKVQGNAALYSLEELEGIAKGNQEFMDKMMHLFHSSVMESAEQAVEEFEKGNFEQVKKLVHKIKPSIKMMRIHQISEEVVEIEKEIVEQKKSDRMIYLMNHLGEVLHLVAKDLKSKNK